MFDILILAAGEGKHMGKGPPKVLRELHGISLIQRIVNTVSLLNHNIYVVTNQSLPITQKNVIFLRQGQKKELQKQLNHI